MNLENNNLQFPVLIGDIGGTNARFQILVDAHAEPKSFPDLLTGDFATVEQAIQAGVLDKTSLFPRSAILAAAGLMASDVLEMTNCHWAINPTNLMHELAIDEVILLNDFEAQALAATSFDGSDIIQLGSGEPHLNARRVVLGPGTGLGVSGLINVRGTWIPVPGEGGHVDIGPQSKKDYEIWPFLKKYGDRVPAEELVSGRGIVNIYNALSLSLDKTPVHKVPDDITAAALAIPNDDPVAEETIYLFCRYLGRIAGNLALIYWAQGGVYIAGGICRKIAPILMESGFREEFENKFPHADLMADIPSYLVTHKSPALAGLAAFTRDQSRFGLEIESRHWRS